MLPFAFGDTPSYLDDSTSVQCTLSSGDLPVTFFWNLNGQSIQTYSGINVVAVGKKTSLLSIDSLSEEHAGNYTCVAQNKAGASSYTSELIVKGTFSIDFYLFVLFFPLFILSFLTVPPQIVSFDFGETAVNSGDMASVICTVHKGDFPIEVTWTLNGRNLEQVEGVSILRTNKRISQLSIDSVDAAHAGEYVCKATNEAGFVEHSAYLRVNGI